MKNTGDAEILLANRLLRSAPANYSKALENMTRGGLVCLSVLLVASLTPLETAQRRGFLALAGVLMLPGVIGIIKGFFNLPGFFEL